MFVELTKNTLVQPISMVQEAKKGLNLSKDTLLIKF